MASQLKNFYFRKLRMVYCSELQLISFLPDLEPLTSAGKFNPTASDLLNLCRQRRNTLEVIAANQDFSIAGDDCQTMRRTISAGRQNLRNCTRGQSREAEALSIVTAVHQLLVVNYSIARSLAVRLQLRRDAKRIEELVDKIVLHVPCEIFSAEVVSPRLMATL